MNKKSLTYAIIILTATLLTGCNITSDKEDKVKSAALEYMKDTYGEECRITDFNYNKRYKEYEIDMQSGTLSGGEPVEVIYEGKGEMFDSYYSNLYSMELTKSIKNNLNLSGKQYAYSKPVLDLFDNPKNNHSYNDFKEFYNIEDTIFTTHLFYASGTETPEEIQQQLINSLEQISHNNCRIKVYLVDEDDLYTAEDYVSKHYRRYSNTNILKNYEHNFIISKEDGIVNTEVEYNRFLYE